LPAEIAVLFGIDLPSVADSDNQDNKPGFVFFENHTTRAFLIQGVKIFIPILGYDIWPGSRESLLLSREQEKSSPDRSRVGSRTLIQPAQQKRSFFKGLDNYHA
jgi:hypothetical protein